MQKSNNKKKEQLNMPLGTAANRLKKELLFKYVKKAGDNFCFQCGAEIENSDQLSVEHKIPYLDSKDPIDLFFNLENIAFSHIKCNVGAARRHYSKCGTTNKYTKGCRCLECTNAVKIARRKNRAKNN